MHRITFDVATQGVRKEDGAALSFMHVCPCSVKINKENYSVSLFTEHYYYQCKTRHKTR